MFGPAAMSCPAPSRVVGAAALAAATLGSVPVHALERPDHEVFRRATAAESNFTAPAGSAGTAGDKCMKYLWPDVANVCDGMPEYFDTCQALVSNLDSKYGGSCDRYCSSFGFECSSGFAVQAATEGCSPEVLTSAAYRRCGERLPGPKGVCVCNDPHDTFLWHDAARTCGAGRVLVRDVGTCGAYCRSQGLTCKGGALAPQGDCATAQPGTCEQQLHGAAAVCECTGSFDRTGAHSWPDQEETCGASAVLVSKATLKAIGGTCSGYCQSLHSRVPGFDLLFSCYGAWPAHSRGCTTYRDLVVMASNETAGSSSISGSGACAKVMSEDAICACSFPDRL